MEKTLAEPKESFVHRLDKPLQKQIIDGVLIERFEVAMKVNVYSLTKLGNLPMAASAVLAVRRLEPYHHLSVTQHPKLQNVYMFVYSALNNNAYVPVEAYMYRSPEPESKELILRTKTFANSNADKEGEKLAYELLVMISSALRPHESTQEQPAIHTSVPLRA